MHQNAVVPYDQVYECEDDISWISHPRSRGEILIHLGSDKSNREYFQSRLGKIVSMWHYCHVKSSHM